MKALVVDDSMVMRRIHQKALEKMGFTVATADDGEQALSVLAGQSCDLMVTDLHMPNLDGLGLISLARGQAQLAGLKILLVTSDGVLDIIEKAMQLGANDVLIKPFSAGVFVERVQGLCGGS